MFSDCRSPRRRACSLRVLLPALAALTAAAALQSGVADAATATNVTITVKPAAVTRATTATFAWRRAGRITSTQCKRDRNRWRACGTSVSYRAVKPGLHTFTVRVRGTRTITRTASWRVDTAAPSAPVVSGGSDAWFAGVRTVTATGSVDTGGAGMAGYQYHVSADGGTTWTAPAVQNPVLVSAPGVRFVQFRAVDKAGNVSAWAPASPGSSGTVKIDVTAPDALVLSGGSLLWRAVASADITVGPLSDAGGSGLAADPLTVETSTDGGTTWSSETPASSATVADEGDTLVRFRAHDAAGNASQWAEAHVRLDRTVPSDPSLAGGSASWFDVASMLVSASGSDDGAGSGVTGYQFETSADGGTSWTFPVDGSSASVADEGETLVRFRAVDAAGLTSGWVQQTVRLDRSAPSAPSIAGTGTAWQALAVVAASASGSVDAGGAGLDHYEYELSSDGGAGWTVAAQGDTVDVTAEGDTLVRFRAVDAAGNASDWTQGSVRLDRTAPSDPVVLGGSAGWLNASAGAITAAGSTDTPGSGIDHYEYETSTDGGTTWSAASTGAAASISDEGETLVRFRAVDGAGLTSGWVQQLVRLDRTDPTGPSLSGVASAWQTVASVTAAASGSTDAGGSGLDHYEYQRSLDGGATWGQAVTGSSADVTGEGRTSLRFRAVDGAGNVSPWVDGAVWLDRTAPTAPTVTGGSLSWLSQAASAVSASGSTDDVSGLDRYELETSTDGGTTWSAPQSAASASTTAEGQTLVRFRAVDAAGLASDWVDATVRLDRTAPSISGVTGGSSLWQNVASLTLSAAGTADIGGSGLDHVEYQTSTDGGSTWSSSTSGTSAAVSAEADTLVRFRAVDGAGNVSGWVQGAARIDRSAPSDPTVAGGSPSWLSQASSNLTASGSADAGSGLAGYERETSTDGGTTWSSPLSGAALSVTAEGQTLVRFRAVDGVGLVSGWVQATVRLDRTAPTSPTVSGGSASWQNLASLMLSAAGSTDAGGSLLNGYESQTSTDGGTSWSVSQPGASATISAEGQTLVRYRAVDGAGNASAWVQGTAKLDRSAPSDPAVAGGSTAWQSVASLTATASGSTDAGSGVTGYELRTSTDGGTTWSSATAGASKAVTAEGQTLVQFRAVDGMGLRSNWVQATLRIDRTLPTVPTVAGGSTAWQALGSVSITATGGTDAGGSGLAGYQYRTSTNGGTTWSAATATVGAVAPVTGEGTTIVQLRTIDGAGNASAWVPTTAGASNTVKLDRTAPTAPTLTGNNLLWLILSTVTVTPSGSTDTGGAGLNHYEVRTSTNAGTTWSAIATATSKAITSQGETLVQFRAVDNVGNASSWTQSTVRLDRTTPTAPTVSGGSTSWQSVASVTISATGGSDSGGSLLTGYQYRIYTTTWSAAASGASVTVTAQGTTLVQFRTVDGAGNTSAWTPSSSGSTNTVKLDRTAPTAPTVSGGSLTCSKTKRTISASNSTDSGGSLFARYEYRVSTNGGTSWGATTTGSSYRPTVAGTYVMQFRAVDGAGLVSAWAPTTNGATNTVCLT